MTNKEREDSYRKSDKIINVGIADIKYTASPYHLRTNLGSCIALILFDKVKLISGLVHIMLPKSFKQELKPGKCADTAVPKIINTMINEKGCKKCNLIVKIFGGAKMLPNTTNDIGMKNTDEVLRLLKESGIKAHTVKTGGTKGYMVQIDTSTGTVMCRVFGEETEFI